MSVCTTDQIGSVMLVLLEVVVANQVYVSRQTQYKQLIERI